MSAPAPASVPPFVFSVEVLDAALMTLREQWEPSVRYSEVEPGIYELTDASGRVVAWADEAGIQQLTEARSSWRRRLYGRENVRGLHRPRRSLEGDRLSIPTPAEKATAARALSALARLTTEELADRDISPAEAARVKAEQRSILLGFKPSRRVGGGW